MKQTMQIRTRTTQGGQPQRFARFLILCFILTLTGCDSTSEPEPDNGTLAVTLSATGEDQPFSFSVRVAGTLQRDEFGATLTFSNLPLGDHLVRLLNLMNCEVQGENPRTVTIPDGGAAQTQFELRCVQAPRVGRIVFSSERDGLANIYVMNEDGTGVRRLTIKSEDGWSNGPRWSPDGKSITFEAGRNGSGAGASSKISVMTPFGGGQKRLSHGFWDTGARWSPDGQRIAFDHSTEANEFVISVMNADGSGLVNLTQNEANTFDWSPDGQHIVIESDGEIYIHNSDGSGGRKLTDGAFPRWSPAGLQIVFKTGPRLNVINADGTGLFRLTPPFEPFSKVWGRHVAWSPDGARIAFRIIADHPERGIHVINADGTNLVKLHEEGGNVQGWSPDGTRILFKWGDDEDLYVINADGTGDLVNLTNEPSRDCCAHWQLVPDIR